MQVVRTVCYWLWRWFSWILLFTLYGAATGILLYLTLGPAFSDMSPLYAIEKGINNGGYYFFVWAPGSAIVLCFIDSWSNKQRRRAQSLSQT